MIWLVEIKINEIGLQDQYTMIFNNAIDFFNKILIAYIKTWFLIIGW